MLGRGGRVRPASLSRRVEGSRCDTQLSGERVTRPSGLCQARRELRVPLRDLVGERDCLRRPPLVSLPKRTLELEEPLLQRQADPGLARQGHRVPGLNVGEPRLDCGQVGCATLCRLPARLFDASELLLGPFALGRELGQCLREELPAAALAFDGRDHSSRQVGLERRAGHDVSVGAGIERGERRFESRGSRDDHDRRRQTESAKLLDERGAALRLHFDDDGRGVAVVFQPFEGRRPASGPTSSATFCAIP